MLEAQDTGFRLTQKELLPWQRSSFGAIVLVSDLGDDLAVGECRLSLNRIWRENHVIAPELVTVSDVEDYSRVHAAFNFLQLAQDAGPETIFIGVVDPGVGTDRKAVIVQTSQEHYFVGPDNGIFYPVANREGVAGLWEIDGALFPRSSVTFHGRDIFAKAAGLIACGFRPEELGRPIDDIVSLEFQQNQILHIDHYGNYKINGEIPPGTTGYHLDGVVIPLVRTFEDVGIGQPLTLRGSSGKLELAIREGHAVEIFGNRIGDCLQLQAILG